MKEKEKTKTMPTEEEKRNIINKRKKLKDSICRSAIEMSANFNKVYTESIISLKAIIRHIQELGDKEYQKIAEETLKIVQENNIRNNLIKIANKYSN